MTQIITFISMYILQNLLKDCGFQIFLDTRRLLYSQYTILCSIIPDQTFISLSNMIQYTKQTKPISMICWLNGVD